MSIACVVCGEWCRAPGRDTLDICPPCFETNFSGAQPPLAVPAPSAREALDDYAMALDNPQIALTPRQVQAMRRAAARWAQEED